MKEERTVSKGTFALVTFAFIVALFLIETLVERVISSSLGLRDSIRGLVGGLAFLNLILGRVMADAFFKRFGLSRSGQDVEGRRPAVFEPIVENGEEAVEIRCARPLSNTLAIVCLLFVGFIFLLSEIVIPHQEQRGREWLPALYGLILGMAALAFSMRFMTIVRVSPSGIAVPPAGNPFGFGRPVPWERVASCDLVAARDTFGKPLLTYPVPKDASGKPLFRWLPQSLANADKQDRDRLLGYLKGRFPKLDQDPWEL